MLHTQHIITTDSFGWVKLLKGCVKNWFCKLLFLRSSQGWMFATANSCFSNQEFSKIGNKVFIPPGVKTYFQRLNRFANIFRKRLTRKQNKQNTCKPNLKSCLSWICRRAIFFHSKWGASVHAPPSGLRGWPLQCRGNKLWQKGLGKRREGSFATEWNKTQRGTLPPHP